MVSQIEPEIRLCILYPYITTKIREQIPLACIAKQFSNLSTLRKWRSHVKEWRSCKEPGRETTEKLPAQIYHIFPLCWSTGHCHWIRRLACPPNLLVISQGTATRNNTDCHAYPWCVKRRWLKKRYSSRRSRNCEFSNMSKKQP